MKAYIYFNSKSKGLDYNGEGQYVLVTEDDKCIGSHYCSSRGFANHDLTTVSKSHHFVLKREKK